MPENNQTVLVAMNADAPWMIPGSIFTRHCDYCQSLVMIAPSGQGYLEQVPAAAIMCYRCFQRGDEKFESGELAADRAVIEQEVRSAVPNTRAPAEVFRHVLRRRRN